MVNNNLVFVACPSGRGTVMLEERKCNIASAVVVNCINSMEEIVSMSRYTYTLRHSASPSLTLKLSYSNLI